MHEDAISACRDVHEKALFHVVLLLITWLRSCRQAKVPGPSRRCSAKAFLRTYARAGVQGWFGRREVSLPGWVGRQGSKL